MSRTEPGAGTPCAEEADGVPAYDWGGVRPDERSSKLAHASRSPESTIGRLMAGGGLALLYLLSSRTELARLPGTSEGERVGTAKACEP